MDWDELLAPIALMTLAAVAPYVAVATVDWFKRTGGRHSSGANAPG